VIPCEKKQIQAPSCVLVNTKKWYKRKADLWAELGDKCHLARKNLLKGIGKGRLRSAVRHRSAEGLFAGEFSGMRGDVARCKERTSWWRIRDGHWRRNINLGI
jgi:hypothetical protein